jgi:hypothetical protein
MMEGIENLDPIERDLHLNLDASFLSAAPSSSPPPPPTSSSSQSNATFNNRSSVTASTTGFDTSLFEMQVGFQGRNRMREEKWNDNWSWDEEELLTQLKLKGLGFGEMVRFFKTPKRTRDVLERRWGMRLEMLETEKVRRESKESEMLRENDFLVDLRGLGGEVEDAAKMMVMVEDVGNVGDVSFVSNHDASGSYLETFDLDTTNVASTTTPTATNIITKKGPILLSPKASKSVSSNTTTKRSTKKDIHQEPTPFLKTSSSTSLPPLTTTHLQQIHNQLIKLSKSTLKTKLQRLGIEGISSLTKPQLSQKLINHLIPYYEPNPTLAFPKAIIGIDVGVVNLGVCVLIPSIPATDPSKPSSSVNIKPSFKIVHWQVTDLQTYIPAYETSTTLFTPASSSSSAKPEQQQNTDAQEEEEEETPTISLNSLQPLSYALRKAVLEKIQPYITNSSSSGEFEGPSLILIERQSWRYTSATAMSVVKSILAESMLFGMLASQVPPSLSNSQSSTITKEKYMDNEINNNIGGGDGGGRIKSVQPKTVGEFFDLSSVSKSTANTSSSKTKKKTSSSASSRLKKKAAVNKVQEILQHSVPPSPNASSLKHPTSDFLSFALQTPLELHRNFETSKKKDDLSDSLLMALAGAEWGLRSWMEALEVLGRGNVGGGDVDVEKKGRK